MDVAWLEALYPHMTAEDCAFAIGTSAQAVWHNAKQRRLRHTPEFDAQLRAEAGDRLRKSGVGHRFQKGCTPPNKGRFGYHAPGSEKGWFKKGHQRNDTAPVGAERIDAKQGYVLVKVADKGDYVLPWRPKHQVVWEAANGPIPAGQVLEFIDRNKQNCTLDNLRLITRAELMKRNSIHNLPPELKDTIRLLGNLKRTINGQQQRTEE